jgi:glutathione synthase/RimK-type ligase-like ATP-grasp enzyme
MKVAILKNEKEESHERWMQSCINLDIPYVIIDLTKADWLEKITNSGVDFLLARPTGLIQRFKDLYDERIYILEKILGYFVFPSFSEITLHENKKFLSYFLNATKIPMPETHVFYYKDEALSFGDCLNSFPIVGKTSNGASGTGVKIIKSHKELKSYIKQAFSKSGIKRRFGPNRNTGNIKTWSKKARLDPRKALKKIKKYFQLYSDSQKGFVILQEYIQHDYEWRVVKIGESWFAHQKIKTGEMASGTKGIDYVNPPIEILDFVKNICDRFNYNSMAVDIFEHPQKGYVVNEMQTLFGHVQDYIMEIDGKIGRYIHTGSRWQFEEGNFNQNESYDLRLKTAIELFKSSLSK